MQLTSRKSTRLVFHSGLGNQLFQWAYLQIMLSKGCSISPAYASSLISGDRPLQVSTLMRDQGLLVKKINKLEYQAWIRLIDNCGEKSYLHKKFLDYREKPFTIPLESELQAASVVTGYFQSFSFIREHSKHVIPILSEYLNNVSLPSSINFDANVIHIRGGDLKDPNNFKKYGVMGIKFYELLPIDSDLNTVIVTDDLERAQLIANRIKVDSIIGPDALDPWQTLKLMVNATNLFAANSTLSLWAAFLKVNRSGSVYIPCPLFRDRNFDANGSLNISGANNLPSHFQDFVDLQG
jgi:hypothetical protein